MTKTQTSPNPALEAEHALLGCLLVDGTMLSAATSVAKPQHFASTENRAMYEAMIALASAQQPIDVTTVHAELRKRGHDADWPAHRVAELAIKAGAPSSVIYHASAVRDAAVLRRLAMLGVAISLQARTPAVAPDEVIARVRADIQDIERDTAASNAVPAPDIAAGVADRVDARRLAGGVSGLSSGFPDLDEMTSGFTPGSLALLAARPAIGKTSLALQMAAHAAEKGVVLFASLEQGEPELGDRLACMRASINLQRLRTGHIGAQEIARVLDACTWIGSTGLWVDDRPHQTVSEIAMQARRLAQGGKLALVVVDYLQLIRPDDPRVPRHEQVACISRGLKLMARDLDCPVLATAQLNRASEERKDGTPHLADLRESGSQEADADLVLLLHRPAQHGAVEDYEGETKLIVAKQRNGPTGIVQLAFQDASARFVSVEKFPAIPV